MATRNLVLKQDETKVKSLRRHHSHCGLTLELCTLRAVPYMWLTPPLPSTSPLHKMASWNKSSEIENVSLLVAPALPQVGLLFFLSLCGEVVPCDCRPCHQACMASVASSVHLTETRRLQSRAQRLSADSKPFVRRWCAFHYLKLIGG